MVQCSSEMVRRIHSGLTPRRRTARLPENSEPNQIVVDYMASMTDDYCAELYHFLYPDSSIDIKYHGYFEDLMR